MRGYLKPVYNKFLSFVEIFGLFHLYTPLSAEINNLSHKDFYQRLKKLPVMDMESGRYQKCLNYQLI